jgi:phospholipase C
MNLTSVASKTVQCLRLGLASIAVFQFAIAAPFASAASEPKAVKPRDAATVTPIKHVIVIVGENRSFDHVFATYVPKSGDKINNLLSEGIIQLDSNNNAVPGPNFNNAQQFFASDTDTFLLAPPTQEYPKNIMPTPLVGGPTGQYGYFSGSPACPAQPKLTPAQCAEVSEPGLPANQGAALASGGTGQTSHTPDTRIIDVTTLPAGPFQITNDATFPYNAYAASPVHRFYQMEQQLNCDLSHATPDNPSGCNGQLFSYVEVSVGAGTNGNQQPPLCSSDHNKLPCFTYNYLPKVPDAQTTGEGSTALAFYNVQTGDAPYFKSLADKYTMSDNFHQSVLGGTGANHIMLGHADALWFTNSKGLPAVPPNNVEVWKGTKNAGVVAEVEDPDPQSNTNNWYNQDGYGGGGYGSAVYGGGSYSDCSDPTQPGVGPVVTYLKSIGVDPRCEPGHYYLLNNYNPGYFGNGKNAYTDHNVANTPFTLPPSSAPSLGTDLNANNISWKYYGDHWNNYVPDPYQLNYGVNGPNADEYCNICNPFQYDTATMSNPAQVKEHIQDVLDLYSDIATGTLPAVSITKPSGYSDGHPASSKLNVFELYCKKIIDAVQNSPYWSDTAIFITFDEGGGYYDSGYVQPVDFFGDGTRIPLLVISKYSTGGHITHDYADHVSIDKFIERNWNIGTISHRSRDNFPNPVTKQGNPYVPVNGPALTDLFGAFRFQK